MSSWRIIALTLFAAFSGLFFVGALRFRSLALLFYAAMFISFANSYRKMKSRDEKSLAFQKEVEARNKEMPWTVSNKDFALILIVSMCASLFLALVTILKQ